MKNILKITLTTLVSAALLSGCIKETVPTNGASSDQIAESPSALEALVRAIPAALVEAGSRGYAQGGAAWDFSYPAIHIALESMSGDLVPTGDTGYDWFSQWGCNQSLGADYAVGSLTWQNYYAWIKNANSLIGTIDEATATPTTKSFLGFAYTYRALFYLDLVRLYEFKENKYTSKPTVIGLGVPIVTPATTEDEAKMSPRAPVADVYKMIFEDLEKATALLEGYTANDKYSISQSVIYGLQARAYLERGTAENNSEAYAKAAEYARKAITASGCTPLTQTAWEDPTTGFNSVSASAWMWGLALPSESIANLYNFTAHMSCEESWTSYGWRVGRGINKRLYDQIDNKDFRKHSWLDPNRDIYAYKSCRPDGKKHFAEKLASYANIKFRPAQGDYANYKVGAAADHVLMRVEEMYFIEIEATAHSNLSAAQTLLNDFMKLRILDGSYDCTTYSSLSDFINEVIFQKRVEFWGEGIIFFDLKRLGISTTRGYKGTNAPADYRLNADGLAPYWNFVISRGEILNHPSLIDFNNPDPSDTITPWIDK